MFRTILVALDGSPISERVLPYARRLAASTAGSLVLVRAVEHADDDALAYLSDVAGRLSAADVSVAYEVAHGHPVEGILRVAQDRQVGCIVMGTHGRSGLPGLLVGSVAEAVLAHSPVPVLLVNMHLPESASPDFDPSHSRVLVPLDGSPFAEAALPAAEELLASDGTLVLTRVVPAADDVATWPDDTQLAYSDDPQGEFDREAREYLEEVAADLRAAREGRAILVDVRAGWPAATIAAAVREHDVSLVVMAVHGRAELRRLVMGSVASDVLRQAQSPLLLVRASLDHQRDSEAPSHSTA